MRARACRHRSSLLAVRPDLRSVPRRCRSGDRPCGALGIRPIAPVTSSATETVVLRAEGVTKRFGATIALGGVSVAVQRGTCLVLIGESGSGKTTLLRCFNRLIDPDDGQIVIDGSPVNRLDPIALRRRIGYVPQDGGLLPHWTVQRNVELVPRLRDVANVQELAIQALELVGLEPSVFAGRRPSQLSGGQ